jgi:hypothetical protein
MEADRYQEGQPWPREMPQGPAREDQSKVDVSERKKEEEGEQWTSSSFSLLFSFLLFFRLPLFSAAFV